MHSVNTTSIQYLEELKSEHAYICHVPFDVACPIYEKLDLR